MLILAAILLVVPELVSSLIGLLLAAPVLGRQFTAARQMKV
ncbi:hypothetical protein [Agrobacterium sp. ST15.13.013]|nr:hypothetical protein [Agrobacterium sp. ST15.13.013]MDA5641388.1 hypothetical protein [Agrobacterium sp. ST15.13.013]MDA5641528.1 hypothetical protein [Agrobacterium sp. ST15.13.013]